MKQIYKIYSSTISFVRAFERAAGVVVLSATLMFNCATTKSADTSSGYVAESTTTSRSADSKEVINALDKIKKINDAESELIKKSLYHMEEAEKAAKIEEQALKAAEEARKKKDEAAKIEEQAAQREKQFLEEAKVLCVKMKEVLEHKEKECATNGCDDETKTKLVNSWRMYEEKCSEYK